MSTVLLELMGYAPDASPTAFGVLVECAGVVPSLKGLKGAPSPADTPLSSLAATCLGSVVVTKLDNTTRLLAGTGVKLYEAGVSTWSDVSRAASYTGGTTSRWRFAQQGNVSLAANGADTIQASTSGAFSCISGAPIAAIVETVGNFVFGLNLSTNAHGWHCSANGNHANWSVSAATQSTTGTLTTTPGPITAGRRFGYTIIAYKKTSMYLGVYVGAPNVWEFSLIPGDVGAMSQEAVVNIGTPENPKHIFMGADDFYIYDGAKAVPIGSNRIKNKVFTDLLYSRYYACAAMHDRKNGLVYFYYPVADSANPDHCVVYNYRTDKWGVDDRQIEATVEYVSAGVTYDSLGGTFATFDAFTSSSYDSGFLNSGQSLPAIFNTSHQVKTLTAPATNTSFTTGDYGDDEVFSFISRLRPRFITKPTSATWRHAYRDNTGDSLTQDDAVALSSAGTFDFCRSARWHRGTMSMVGDWELAVLAASVEEDGLE